MKLTEIASNRPDSELPTTAKDFIEYYGIRTGPFLPMDFGSRPNMVTSLEGVPFMAFSLDIRATKVSSLDGDWKMQYVNSVSLLKCPLRNYHDIHKHIRECSEFHGYVHATNLLGLFKCVQKPSSVFPNRIRLYDEGDKQDNRATELFNTLHSKDLTIYELQEALVDAGFSEDQANL